MRNFCLESAEKSENSSLDWKSLFLKIKKYKREQRIIDNTGENSDIGIMKESWKEW